MSFSSGFVSTRATTNCSTTKTNAPISTKWPTTPNRNINTPRLKIAAQSLFSDVERGTDSAFFDVAAGFGAALTASGFAVAAFAVDAFLAVVVAAFFGAAFAVAEREGVFFVAADFVGALAGAFVAVAGLVAFVRDVLLLAAVLVVAVARAVLLVAGAFFAVAFFGVAVFFSASVMVAILARK